MTLWICTTNVPRSCPTLTGLQSPTDILNLGPQLESHLLVQSVQSGKLLTPKKEANLHVIPRVESRVLWSAGKHSAHPKRPRCDTLFDTNQNRNLNYPLLKSTTLVNECHRGLRKTTLEQALLWSVFPPFFQLNHSQNLRMAATGNDHTHKSVVSCHLNDDGRKASFHLGLAEWWPLKEQSHFEETSPRYWSLFSSPACISLSLCLSPEVHPSSRLSFKPFVGWNLFSE